MTTPITRIRPTPTRLPASALAWAKEHRMGWCIVCRDFTAEHVYDRAKNVGTVCPADGWALLPLWMAMQLGVVAEEIR